MDHYAQAVYSEPGRCWRFVASPGGTGRPTHCPEPVEWAGTTLLKGVRRIPVWSCDGHREGVDGSERTSPVPKAELASGRVCKRVAIEKWAPECGAETGKRPSEGALSVGLQTNLSVCSTPCPAD